MSKTKLRRKRIFRFLLLAVLLLAAWIAVDLYAPRTTHLREFNPDEVARLETAMWRSYYDKQRARLFYQLGELLRTQYHMPFFRSNLVAYHGARAAVVFQRGKQRSDYEKALPDLIKFYQAVRNMSDLPFDVNRAAQLEVEWWIIHRERARHAPVDLETSLAQLQAEIYGLPVERLREHGRLRAEAMTIRDTQAETGGVSEEDWRKIDSLLHGSWRSLAVAVNS